MQGGQGGLLLGNIMEGVNVTVMEEVVECYILDRVMVAEKGGFVVWKTNRRILIPSHSLYEWLDTALALI